VLPAPGAGVGITPGLLIGVGPDKERNTGPNSGEGEGFAAAWGVGSGLAGVSGARTELSTPGEPAAAGEVAGRITTRGVAEAPGAGALSPGDGEDSAEGLVFSFSSECLLR
jgi:hypothetical protein